MTKRCKACREEIDAAATKCPRCQAYQHWYRSPQAVSWLLVVPILAFTFWNMRTTSVYLEPPKFADFKDKFAVEVVGEESAANGTTRLLTVQLRNGTDKTWKHPTFQIESSDAKGNVVSVEHVDDYRLVVAPNASVLDTLSLRVTPAEAVAKRKVTLTDIEPKRF